MASAREGGREIRQCLAALGELRDNPPRTNGRVLHVRTGLAFKAQRFTEVECDD